MISVAACIAQKVMVLVGGLDDWIVERSKRAPRYQFEIPGIGQKVLIFPDSLIASMEAARQARRRPESLHRHLYDTHITYIKTHSFFRVVQGLPPIPETSLEQMWAQF